MAIDQHWQVFVRSRCLVGTRSAGIAVEVQNGEAKGQHWYTATTNVFMLFLFVFDRASSL
jgi:hypothetical protein